MKLFIREVLGKSQVQFSVLSCYMQPPRHTELNFTLKCGMTVSLHMPINATQELQTLSVVKVELNKPTLRNKTLTLELHYFSGQM
jgi:hypothetical protein